MIRRRAGTSSLVRRIRKGRFAGAVWSSSAPIREELLSAERLETRARSLAEAQGPGEAVRGRPLADRLADNEAALIHAYQDSIEALDEGAAITPAAEWLIDNFHVIEKQIREVRLDLPAGYYRQLPKIPSGPLAGYPRVFGIAWTFVAHTDSHFDCDLLCRFLRAYQEVEPLTIGELWAVAITLRIVMVENLRRVAERIVISRAARAEADRCCDRMLGAGGQSPEDPHAVLRPYEDGPLLDSFVAQIRQRMRNDDLAAAPALTWLDERLALQGASADDVVRDEQQSQVAATLTVRNIVTGLRLISDVDWAEVVERISLVDDQLKAASAFADMDFATRNLYRNAIEELARHSGLAELDVTRRVVQAVRLAETNGADPSACDPGHYLMGAGRNGFEAALGFRAPVRSWTVRIARRLGLGGYLAWVAFWTALCLAAPLMAIVAMGVHTPWLALVGALGLLPALDVGIAIVNRRVTHGVRAMPLPALELKGGIPSRLRTLVAVPVMLTDAKGLEAHIERLEIHHLSSPEGHLHFALLSDWPDADREEREGDLALFEAARAGVARLNARYGAVPGGDRFLLFHRKRVWSESEGRWMGWERKRGKLQELNRVLRGAGDTTFMGLQDQAVPKGVRYVITLDADTKLPRDSVRRMIGKMAHPLNRPRFDAAQGRVVEGYGILQPRITPSLPIEGEGSLFRRVFTSVGGIDPYAAAVSDVYQDLFGEGSYAGKGIYDIDAFEAALKGRTPEAALLSHDLFEGVFARAGLASDVEVVEDFPERYDVDATRRHRWARGDWQLLPWILGFAGLTDADGRSAAVPAVGRWKMIDNLRRTVSPAGTILSLWAAWLLPLPAAATWTVFVLAAFAGPPLVPVLASIGARRPGIPLRARLYTVSWDLHQAMLQAALSITLLADQAALMADAIARTLWRLFVSHRLMLQWVPAAQAAAGLRFDMASFYRRMAAAPAIGVATVVLAVIADQSAWILAAPFGLLWIASPAIALFASRAPSLAVERRASEGEIEELRRIARRTWRFFETFVSAEDNLLPPDNYQEDPAAVAHRTSPTNIGLYLLSAASARDFGWIGAADALGRLEATLATLGRMERFRGHFYNWYDTQDLRPLDPKYISSVDSGNLAGHLITLAHAVQDWAQPTALGRRLGGVADALGVLREEADALRHGGDEGPTWRALDQEIDTLARALDAAHATASGLPEILALAGHANRLSHAAEALAIEWGAGDDLLHWAQAVEDTLASHRRDLEDAARDLAPRIATLAGAARDLALAMDFAFLIDPERMLLSIGYRVPEGELDPSCYDLLGSEARLASFIAIAKGDAPARHWFRLGHAVTPVAHGAALISWSGSMFEYLMPSLVMRAPPGSLLEQTNRLVVRRQIEYAASLRLPWGISESAYNVRDLEFTYQYQSFGVPSLGLKRGLSDHMVIAPYATALAAMVDAHAACENFQVLAQRGAAGRFGFYEAVDYTPSRVPDGQACALVRAFMAHHQGMTIVAIANAVTGGEMRECFHAEPMVQATELLLEERMPREVVVSSPSIAHRTRVARAQQPESPGMRRITHPHTRTPAAHLLSNGRYSVMLTAAGSGYSRWRDVAITRWREDATCDAFGAYVFLRDVQSGLVWSAGHQPAGVEADAYEAVFSENRAEISRQDGQLTTSLEVIVSAEDDAEVRRLTIANAGLFAREVEITSYAELVLAPQAADVAHPAFSKLFVQTEHLAAPGALIASRRRRSPQEEEVWAAQLVVLEGEQTAPPEFETSRAEFLGRGRDLRHPLKVFDGRPLGGGVGTVLDPAFVLRRRVRVPPRGSVKVSFWTLAADSRKALLDLIDKHHDATAFERAASLAWTQALVQLHHLDIDRGEAALFQQLGEHIVFSTPLLRPSGEILEQRLGAQPELWRVGISGDLPIVLVRVADAHDLGVARQVIKAAEYLRSKQLAFDLVLLNERGASYIQDLQIALESVVRASQSRTPLAEHSPPGRTAVLRADLIPGDLGGLLAAIARVVVTGQGGTLAEQLARISERRAAARPRSRARSAAPGVEPPARQPPQLEFFNGLGGFGEGGREYVTILAPGQSTPAPWINVVANPELGFQVSATGAGYTWRLNSREHQLTPWSNDPVIDGSGEAIYIRDEDTGDLWSPTAWPIREEMVTYVARHGRGYSRFESAAHGLEADLLQFAPMSDPVKISRLTLRNTSGRARRLSVTAYAEWALGAVRAAAAPFTVTRIDEPTGAMFARNTWNPAFSATVAFADLGGAQVAWTGDRAEFIGRNGSLRDPAALGPGVRLSGRTGAGLDPCSGLQTAIELPAGGTCEVIILLGEAADEDAARELVARYRAADLELLLAGVSSAWDEVLDAVQVKTPDRSMDLMLNGWLLYQTVASRLWGRCGFYQASGAYGFRDQLQDVMALAALKPAATREHLLRAGARQFEEGDVQHWWLPQTGHGVRTRMTDDRVWLAYVVAHYIRTTGDAGVLDEMLPFLTGPRLEGAEAESFYQPGESATSASLYEHCARALDCSLELGGHGLPLIGTGDWNDGMNRVGERGLGESVWLGWFLYAALRAFIPLARGWGDAGRVSRWESHAQALQAALERNAWDGGWYRRAWFDEGAPLGSAVSDECRIDSIAQSWAVLSGAAPPERSAKAMAEVERQLILPDAGLALLFTPPFDRTPLDPGYIKAYPPGLRENGGQYTHAAAWSVMAFAVLGQGEAAGRLFHLLNPINHAATRSAVHRYKVEPYVIAADVYSAPGHEGRGGWTWYTGSAAWMQRAGIESILGLRRLRGLLTIDPCIPPDWPGFEAVVRHGAARYEIVVENPHGVSRGLAQAELDGRPMSLDPLLIELNDDGAVHRIRVTLGEPAMATPHAASEARR